MSCYRPTLIYIYTHPECKKKITKIEKIDIRDKGRKIAENYHQMKLIEFINDKGQKVKDYCYCQDITQIPCGECIGCANDYAKHRTHRLLMENECHEKGYFITLTYDDNHIPNNYQLNKNHAKKFIKQMQNLAYRQGVKKFKYYLVGEYGKTSGRPHLHCVLWDINLIDLKPVTTTKKGFKLYKSKQLSEYWTYGQIGITADINGATFGYVANYASKKRVTSRETKKRLKLEHIQPEFMLCSKKLAYEYYEKNYKKIIANGNCTYINGQKITPDRSFIKWLKLNNMEKEIDTIKKEINTKARIQYTNRMILEEETSIPNQYLKNEEKRKIQSKQFHN